MIRSLHCRLQRQSCGVKGVEDTEQFTSPIVGSKLPQIRTGNPSDMILNIPLGTIVIEVSVSLKKGALHLHAILVWTVLHRPARLRGIEPPAS